MNGIGNYKFYAGNIKSNVKQVKQKIGKRIADVAGRMPGLKKGMMAAKAVKGAMMGGAMSEMEKGMAGGIAKKAMMGKMGAMSDKEMMMKKKEMMMK